MTDSDCAHLEAALNTAAGILIAQGLLWLWGMSFNEAVGLNVAFLGVSYVRMYVIRIIFAAWQKI